MEVGCGIFYKADVSHERLAWTQLLAPRDFIKKTHGANRAAPKQGITVAWDKMPVSGEAVVHPAANRSGNQGEWFRERGGRASRAATVGRQAQGQGKGQGPRRWQGACVQVMRNSFVDIYCVYNHACYSTR